MANPTPTPPPPPSTPKKRTEYPDPLIIPPLQHHKQTFIILHGRGSNALAFGPPLLDTQVSGTRTFRSAFPHAKFVFPTARKCRAKVYNRSVINQWFDNWSLATPNEETGLHVQGLRESSAYVHSLLRNAIAQVGARNVVLGGLSQGCAAALIALLTWDGEPIVAAFGMCGWLPFRKQMEDILVASESGAENMSGDVDDLFESGDEADGDDNDAPTQAVAFLREELAMSAQGRSMVVRQIPLFLGHGTEDEKVPIGLGRGAASCLERLGVRADWREYDGLGHWYSSAMLGDIVDNLRMTTSWGQHQKASEYSE
ncbi:MAG: hypothetical protein LQ337_004589 [Flavoplaca oasis]|nr:MAG: hypothetical protein LQ337_004589 [Flavoplaca oasis]